MNDFDKTDFDEMQSKGVAFATCCWIIQPEENFSIYNKTSCFAIDQLRVKPEFSLVEQPTERLLHRSPDDGVFVQFHDRSINGCNKSSFARQVQIRAKNDPHRWP